MDNTPARCHPVYIAGVDIEIISQTVLVAHFAAEQIGHSGKADMRMRANIDAGSRFELRRTDDIKKSERPHHPPLGVRQHATNGKAAKVVHAGFDDDLNWHVCLVFLVAILHDIDLLRGIKGVNIMSTLTKIAVGILLLGLGGCLDLEQDYVAVVGVGEARQFPDTAAVSVSVTRKGDTSARAVEALNTAVMKLRDVGEAFDVQEEDVHSVYLDITKSTRHVTRADGSSYSEPSGYEAEQYLRFEIKDIGRAGESLGALVMAGAEGFSQPVYLISDEAKLFENARQLAMKDAKRRAVGYAASTGKTLGTVEIVEESGTDSQRLNFQLRDRLVKRYAQEESIVSFGNSPARMISSNAPSTVYSRPQEIAVTVSIYVKYALDG